jgi:hypothetical protein
VAFIKLDFDVFLTDSLEVEAILTCSQGNLLRVWNSNHLEALVYLTI